MKNINLSEEDKIVTHIIETVGKSNLKGSYLRYYNEVVNRHIKISHLAVKLAELGKNTDKNNRIIAKHKTFVTKYLNRLAQYILHTHTHTDQKGWNKYYRENPMNKVFASVGYVPPPRNQSPVSRLMRQSTYNQAKSFYAQKIAFEIEMADKKGWYMVFDTLKFADEKLKEFYDDYNNNSDTLRPLNVYMSNYANCIAKKLRIKPGDKVSRESYYRYFIVPEYGDKTNRLHFHVLHLMKVLPCNAIDPNLSNPNDSYREVPGMKYKWKYSTQTTPIAVRYSGDSYGTKLKWKWVKRIDQASGNLFPLPVSDSKGLSVYMSKYVAKGVDLSESEGDRWNLGMRRKGIDARKVLRITVSRGFGFNDIADMSYLSVPGLVELTKLSSDSTPWYSLLKHAAKRKLKSMVSPSFTVEDINRLAPEPINFTSITKSKLGLTKDFESLPKRFRKIPFESLSNEVVFYLEKNNYAKHQQPKKPNHCFGGG